MVECVRVSFSWIKQDTFISEKLHTVPAPIKAADTIQKLYFNGTDYHIKKHKKSFLAWNLKGAATNREQSLMARVRCFNTDNGLNYYKNSCLLKWETDKLSVSDRPYTMLTKGGFSNVNVTWYFVKMSSVGR